MKTTPKTWVALTSFALLLGLGCDHDHFDRLRDFDSDEPHTQTFALSGFDEIECEDAFRLSVRQAESYRVSATVPDCLRNRLDIRQAGSVLHIGLSAGGGCREDRREASVELPALVRLGSSAACHVDLAGIASAAVITLDARAASRVTGDLSAATARISLSSASEASLSGRAARLELEVREASRARLSNLATQQTDAHLGSASSATVRVSHWLDVTASGVSTLRYIGNPQLGRVELSGASHLERQAD